MPTAYLEDLLGAVQELEARIPACEQPPREEKGKKKGRKKKDKHEEEDD